MFQTDIDGDFVSRYHEKFVIPLSLPNNSERVVLSDEIEFYLFSDLTEHKAVFIGTDFTFLKSELLQQTILLNCLDEMKEMINFKQYTDRSS